MGAGERRRAEGITTLFKVNLRNVSYIDCSLKTFGPSKLAETTLLSLVMSTINHFSMETLWWVCWDKVVTHIHSLDFCGCNKHCHQRQSGEERICWASTSRSRSVNEESQGRTQAGAEAEAFGGTLLTGLLSYKAEDNLPGMVLPMMSWALLHQLAMKIMSEDMLQAILIEQCFNRGFLLPGDLLSCQVGKRN